MGTEDRPPLSRELIAETALRLTDEVGLAGLSMRRLGAELGVEAMSLYHYVSNKEDLLDAVLERLYSEIDLPLDVPDDKWEVALRGGLSAFNDVLLAHPGAVQLFTTRPATSTAAIKVLHWAYQRFELRGLTPAQAAAAFRFSVAYVMGRASMELGSSPEVPTDESLQMAGVADPAHRAFLLEHGKLSAAELFDTGLDLVVAGLRTTYERLQ
ncbi:MAG: TetR/AcrR family transcriptional regulator [Acidimicrobiales bacterium]